MSESLSWSGRDAGAGPHVTFLASFHCKWPCEQKKSHQEGENLGLESFVEKEGKSCLEQLGAVADRSEHLDFHPNFWDSFPSSGNIACSSRMYPLGQISTSLLCRNCLRKAAHLTGPGGLDSWWVCSYVREWKRKKQTRTKNPNPPCIPSVLAGLARTSPPILRTRRQGMDSPTLRGDSQLSPCGSYGNWMHHSAFLHLLNDSHRTTGQVPPRGWWANPYEMMDR